jgi:hypothetical protein
MGGLAATAGGVAVAGEAGERRPATPARRVSPARDPGEAGKRSSPLFRLSRYLVSRPAL